MKVRRGDIHWIEFPGSSTREQAGRRPAIIAQADSVPLVPTVFVVPLTSNPPDIQRLDDQLRFLLSL